MPVLNELGGGDSPTKTTFVANALIVEPLDGPTSVEDVMDRFPEEVYQQGRDSHLFRLLTALCGDAGAGLAKKQAYATRLRYEAEFVSFSVLDEFYAAQFRLQRLASETYSFKVDVDALTPLQWNQVLLADQSYQHRMREFWSATRLGNSPEGIRLAAQAGTGIDSEIVEHYKYLFDLLSDMPLGLQPEGISTSTSEFVIIPRLVPNGQNTYLVESEEMWNFTPPDINTTTRPATLTQEWDNVVEYINPVTKIDLVGSDSVSAVTIAIPPHAIGDLIVISASRFGGMVTVPTAGGTVPTWTTHGAEQSNSLSLTTVSTVATTTSHTSGTFTNANLMNVAVFRPTDGTLSVGAVSKRLHGENNENQSPYIKYPALDLQNDDGTSTVYRPAAVRESATDGTTLTTPPADYTFVPDSSRPATWALVSALAAHYRPYVYNDPTLDQVKVTTSPGPGGYVAYSIEIKMTPNPGIVVETREEKEARYLLESTSNVVKAPFNRLLPAIERNGVEILDRLRPANTIFSWKPEDDRYSPIEVDPVPVATSERINVSRFVLGNADVAWPPVDPSQGFFIEAGVEREQGHFYGASRELPIIFLTIDGITAYMGEATTDSTYGTSDFYNEVNGVSPYEQYQSEQIGSYFPVLSALFPFVYQVGEDAVFTADQAVASQNSLMMLEGQAIA